MSGHVLIDEPPEACPDMHIDQVLDVRGFNCPLPLLKAKLALNRLQPGQVIHILATDPMAVVDFRAFCARTGHTLPRVVEGGEVFEFYIRKSASARCRNSSASP